MAVYYKFKSAKDYDSIPIEGQFISLGTLKERIFESKHLGRGTDFDLTVSNAQNNEEYLDEAAMIPKNTSVLIRRVPRRLQKTIVTEPDEPKFVEDKVEELPPPSNMLLGDSSTMKYPEESEWDEFGNDLYAIPEVVPAQPSNPVMDVSPANKADEESKIKALIEMPALDWNRQAQDGYGGGRGLGRGGMGGRMMSGRGFGRGGFERPFERKTPPVGYICHRCKIPGHFIQHCPTNGDPNFDIRKVKPPTGIPKSMLMANPDGSYALPSGAVAVLKPNEAAFEKEIEGLPSIRPVSDLPPELRCPLCKEVMKDAVLTSKCCFRSFCDKCIRDYIITKSMCVCGATNILADDLLPNKTLRETISRILESATSSTENAGSLIQVQDMESARPMPPKVPSPTLSVASKGEPTKNPPVEYSQNVKESEAVSEEKTVNVVAHSSEKKITKNTEPSEATPESVSVKEPVSPESTHVLEEAQDKLLGGEQGKKKKKKKTRPPSSAVDMQWRTYQDLGAENYAGMPLGPSPYNPYWGGGMPLGVDGYMAPFAGSMPYMGYTPGPFDVPFGGMLPQDPFAAQGYMLPMVPRDLSELGVNSMGMNQGPPVMSREEFEARKADLRRKREMERMNEREHSRDGRGASREVSSSGAEGSSMRAKTQRLMPRGASMDRAERSDRADRTERERGRPDRPHSSARESARESSRRSSPPRPPKRKSSSDREEAAGAGEVGGKVAAAAAAAAAAADRKQKASVFSRISFPAGGEAAGGSRKKRKSSEPPVPAPPSKDRHRHHRESSSASAAVATATAKANGHRSSSVAAAGGGKRSAYQRAGSSEEEEEEEEEHHFKRRPSSSSRREEREREKRR